MFDLNSPRFRIAIAATAILLFAGAVTQIDWPTQVKRAPIVDIRTYANCDGTTDVSASVQAAFTAAASGSTVVFPPSVTCVFGTAGISISKAVTVIVPRSTTLTTNAGFPSNADLVSIQSPQVYWRGGLINTANRGRDAFRVGDGVVNGYSDWSIEGAQIVSATAGNAGVHVVGAGAGDNANWRISDNTFSGTGNYLGSGIICTVCGDTNEITGNIISLGPQGEYAIYWSGAAGAAHGLIAHNNISGGGKNFVHIERCEQCKILYNQMESSFAPQIGTDDAILYINGFANSLEIVGNNLNAHSNVSRCIYLNNVQQTHIRANECASITGANWLVTTITTGRVIVYPNVATGYTITDPNGVVTNLGLSDQIELPLGGRIGIGSLNTSTAAGKCPVGVDQFNVGRFCYDSTAFFAAPTLEFVRNHSNGAVQANDLLAWFRFGGKYDAANLADINTTAQLRVVAPVTWDATHHDSEWLFNTSQGLSSRNAVKLPSSGGMQLFDTASKPVCSAVARGTYYYTAGGAGVKDSVEVCAKDAADAYAWRTIY